VRRIVKRFSVVSAGALFGSSFGLVPAADASTVVTCGQIITTNTTLANDIGPCFGDGLIVKGFRITVDLAGHTIMGAVGPASTIDQAGIHLDNVSGVTIKGGTVRGFSAGVLVKRGSGNTITAMKVINNVGLGTTLYNDGIVLDGSTNNRVTTNRVTGNGPEAGIHMVNSASNNRIFKNFVADNDVPSIGRGPGGVDQALDSGIANDSDASFNVISDNQVLRNGFFGIKLAGVGTSHDQAIHNTVKDNGNTGINAGGNGHTVSGNLIDHNGYQQFLPVGADRSQGGTDGVVTCGRTRPPGRPCGNDPVIIQDNTITRNAGIGVNLVLNGFQDLGGCGLSGCFPPAPYAAPRSNLVQRNVVRDNGHDGIFIECDTLYDADGNGTCLTTTPLHEGQQILNNTTSGNGGVSAGTVAWDLHDQNPNCDHDIWSGNTYETANPLCTTATSPPPPPVTACGAVLTADTTLSADVGPCPADGLIIGADSITLDLNGHRVFAVSDPQGGEFAGIHLRGVSGAIVRNGSVSGFDAGVFVDRGSGNLITRLTAHDNIGGTDVASVLGDGVLVFHSAGNTIADNEVFHNGVFDGIGVLGEGSGSNVIRNNSIRNNDVANGPDANEDDGIRLDGPNATNTRIEHNTVTSNGLDGIAVFADNGTGLRNTGTIIAFNTVEQNGFGDKAQRKGDGIVLFGLPTDPAVGGADFSHVHDNQVNRNAGNGIRVDSQHNEIVSNHATGNAASAKGFSFDLSDINLRCATNKWAGDTFGTRNRSCIR